MFLSIGLVSASEDFNLDDYGSSDVEISSIEVVDYEDTVELNDNFLSDDINDNPSPSDLTINDSAKSSNDFKNSSDLNVDASVLNDDSNLDNKNKEQLSSNVDEKKLSAYKYVYFSISPSNINYGSTEGISYYLYDSNYNYLYKSLTFEIWSNDNGYDYSTSAYTSSSGSKTLYLYNLEPGTYYVRATFNGDSTYYSKTSSSYSFVVYETRTSTYFSISASDIDYGNTAYIYTSLYENYYDDRLYEYVTLNISSDNGYDNTLSFYTSSSGSKTTYLYSLNPGTYYITAEFSGDSYYAPTTYTTSFYVYGKTTPTFSISVSDIDSGSTEYIYTYLVDSNGNYLNKYVSLNVYSNNGYNDTLSFYTSSSGSKTTYLYSLNPGTYYVRANFSGDSYYYSTTSSTYSFKVIPPKTNSYVDVYAENALEGNSVFNISLTNEYGTPLSNKALEIVIYNSSHSYYEHFTKYTNSKGNYSLSVKNLTPGYYYIDVSFDGDSTYYSSSDSSSFTIYSKDTKINVYAESCTVGESAEIGIDLYNAYNERLSGKVNVYVDNKFYGSTTTSADERIYYSIDGLSDGNFLITVGFDGNSSYRSSQGNDNLKVYRVSQINATVKDVVYGAQTVLNVTLTDINNSILYKNFTVHIYDDYSYSKTITVTGNQYIVINSYDLVEDRIYYVDANFRNDELYANASASTEFKVLTKNTHIGFVVPHPATDENVQAYVTLYDDGYNPIAGTVSVQIDNKTYTVKTKDIEDNLLSIGKLTEGNHTVFASFKGNETYFSSNLTDTLRIYKGSILTINTNNIVSGKNAVLNFVLKGTNGKALNAEIYVLLESIYDYDSKEYIVNITNGKGSLTVKGLKTNYAVFARYSGDKEYIGADQIEFIRILKNSTVKVTASNINYGTNENIIVNLLGDGKNITGTVTVYVGSKSYKVAVNNGKGNVTISGLAVGKYNIVAYYEGNNTYLDSTAQTSFNVNKCNSKIIYSDMVTTAVAKVDGRVGKYFIITLKDTNGKALANKKVQIGFNGAIYNRTTDSNGGARLQINLGYEGIYTFAVAYLGDDIYNGSFVVAKITVKKHNPKLTAVSKSFKNTTKIKSVSATLKSANGHAIGGKSLVFIVNVKLYNAKTNSKGFATVNISLNKKGTYTCTVRSTGDSMYAATSTKFNVKIV